MSIILASISSNVFKKTIPLYASISIKPPQFLAIPNQKIAITSIRAMGPAHDPTYVPGNSPPEVPTAPPSYNPGIPPEMPRRHNVPEFDPVPPESPTPDLPGPPGSPKPETPPPPSEPEVVPPSEPEITPPEPGLPHPTPPDSPPPIMGSNGLVFY